MSTNEKHAGELVELAIRRSGYNIKEIARRLNISRSTLYNRFKRSKLDPGFILTIGRLINYNFGDHLPELALIGNNNLSEQPFSFNQPTPSDRSGSVLLHQHYQLLQGHDKLMSLCVQLLLDPTIKDADEMKAILKHFFEDQSKQFVSIDRNTEKKA